MNYDTKLTQASREPSPALSTVIITQSIIKIN